MCRRGAGRRGTCKPQAETRRKMIWQERAPTSGSFWTSIVVDVSTGACEQDQLENVGGKGAFVGELSERDLDRQITRLARQKVSKLEGDQAGAGRSSVRAACEKSPHQKKKSSSSRRSGCRGEAQDAQSSLQELDLNPTAQSAGQGWSSSCVKMPRRGGADSIAKAAEEVEDRVPASSDADTRCVNATLSIRGWRRRKRQAAANEPKMVRLMKKRGQVRRAGDSRLEDHNVAVKEVAQIQRRTLELCGLDATRVNEIFSFGRFKEKLAPYDRPQVEEVCVGPCSTSSRDYGCCT